ncbi:MAG: hypothetical protein V8S14_07960 [Lachnospiraceae bacterium]
MKKRTGSRYTGNERFRKIYNGTCFIRNPSPDEGEIIVNGEQALVAINTD